MGTNYPQPLISIHAPATDIIPLKTACGCPCGRVTTRIVTRAILSPCRMHLSMWLKLRIPGDCPLRAFSWGTIQATTVPAPKSRATHWAASPRLSASYEPLSWCCQSQPLWCCHHTCLESRWATCPYLFSILKNCKNFLLLFNTLRSNLQFMGDAFTPSLQS